MATATRAQARDIAAIGADLQKLQITNQSKAFAVLAKQADVGSVELRDLVSQGPRLLSAFAGAGLVGEQGLRRGGALAQVFQAGTGNVERTSTAVEATFRDIAEKRDVLKRFGGIEVAGRDRTEVLQDIIRKTGGDEFKLRRIFGDEAFRGVGVMATEFRRTGRFSTFERFANVEADSSILDRKFQLNTSSAAARIKRAQVGAEVAADRNLGGLVETIGANAGIGTKLFDFATSHPLLAGGLGIGGAILGRAAIGTGRQLVGRALFGGPRGPGGIGEAIAGAAGGSPVFVTNWPPGFSGGGLPQAIGEAVSKGVGGMGTGGLVGKLLAAFGGGGGLALAGGGVAASLAALTAAVAPLHQAMPKIRAETEELLKRPQRGAETRTQRGREQADLLFQTVGRFGGAVTSAQAHAAARGFGAYGRSASQIQAMFKEQQNRLRTVALGEKYGVGEDVIESELGQGGQFLFASLMKNPEFAKAKPGKERAAVLERLIAQNERDARHGTKAPFPEAGQGTTGAASAPYFFGLEKLVPGATSGASELGHVLREALGLTFHITIHGDEATVEGESGTRSPSVKTRRVPAGVD